MKSRCVLLIMGGFKNIVFQSAFVFLITGNALFAAGNDFSAAAAKAKPSVVYISVYTQAEGQKELVKSGYGSGTIVTRDGYVLTNYHVVSRGDHFQVVLDNGIECDIERFKNGSYFLADEETDIALLKIRHPDQKPFIPFDIGDSDQLMEGQWVIAIGNPYGLRHSVTCGIISSLRRSDVGFAEIEDFIQTDVPINPGNSGGPLVNQKGECIGINAAIRTISGGYQGISFAIPSKLAMHVFKELLSNGRVRRGWLGVLVQEERRRSDSDAREIRVISVAKDSPAFHAGIREGDIVRKADGVVLTSQGRLMKMVKNKEVGSSIHFTVARDGKLYEYTLVLREKESYRTMSRVLMRLYDYYGIELSENASSGAVILRLSPDKLDMHGGSLREGDVFVSLNGGKIKNLDDFVRIYAKWDYSISKGTVFRDGKIYLIDFKSGAN
jgi:serine protease Do